MLRPQNERGRIQFASADNTDLPDPGLIALHRACANILGISGAGEYIDKLLRDDENVCLERCGEELEQGTLDLAGMVARGLALHA